MPTPTRDGPDVRAQPLFRREAITRPDVNLAELYHENTKFHSALMPLEQDPMAGDDSELGPTESLQYVPLDGPGRIALPPVGPELAGSMTLHETVAARRSRRSLTGASVPLASLATVLFHTYGVTGTLEGMPDEPGRAAPSAGGRFPLELYVAARNVDDLSPGWYHYHPETHTLETVHEHDPGPDLDRTLFGQSFLADAAFVLVLGALLSRTLSRYGERGYRLVLLDAGHAGAHAYLSATALGLGACGLGGFLDDELSAILKLDGVDEVVLYGVSVGVPTAGP